METQEMGRVLVEIFVENLRDAWAVESNTLAPDQARNLTIEEALVDTGATTLSLPTRYIQELGLKKVSEKRVSTAAGPRMAGVYDAVRLTIMDRQCTVDVVEVPDTTPTLVGQIPLEMLDFVVDPRGQRLIGNPAHDGEHVIELY